MARFSGSKSTFKTPREIELEKVMQAWQKEKAIRAAKKKRRADKKTKYGYVDRGLWQNFKNCFKAGYSSPLPMYRRPLAFLSLENLQYGWQKTNKHIKKRTGFSKMVAILAIATEPFIGFVSYGVVPLLHILFPRISPSTLEKFILAVQERAADKLRK